ncbi:MAG TPA: hypothetical protein PKE35_00980 [Anaerolineales bacterium]|nr:hypothetical protein [Anaerolineales bacterium]HMV95127.1 hypothetical protein [Anaerolineales bacterium]HMX18313.1 hypothetical protein [Anaerolineales bacterium]HMX72789.1 hypothetical protein [Anaerolineales bacterium]HMZ41809.1 hypothetical protein [Anaerolineales bacterium]
MAEIYNFLASYEALIYIVLAIGGLFSFRWLWRSWRESQTAVFTMEREFSSRRLGQAAAISTIIAVLFCAEFFVATFIIPGLPSTALIPTSTLDLISTPTGTLSAEAMTQFANLPPQPASVSLTGCTPNQIMLTSPTPGQEVQGTITLVGTVNIPNFGFYKYEVAPQGGSTWATISAGRETVVNGKLGEWITNALTPGDYQLRLVVTDNQGVSLPACVVPVRVMP